MEKKIEELEAFRKFWYPYWVRFGLINETSFGVGGEAYQFRFPEAKEEPLWNKSDDTISFPVATAQEARTDDYLNTFTYDHAGHRIPYQPDILGPEEEMRRSNDPDMQNKLREEEEEDRRIEEEDRRIEDEERLRDIERRTLFCRDCDASHDPDNMGPYRECWRCGSRNLYMIPTELGLKLTRMKIPMNTMSKDKKESF